MLGTNRDNMDDRNLKGRARGRFSKDKARKPLPEVARLPRAFEKVSEEQVRTVKRLLEGGMSAVAIAKNINTTAHIVYHIKSGKTWRHVT